jgi:hypothetical protein
MFVNPKILEQGRAPDSLFAFFHAQRTGGSAFLRWLGQTFPKDQIFSRPTTGLSYAHWNKIDAARLAGSRVFGGFSQYTEKADLTRPLVCLSLSRHPFYRIVSVYHMSRRDKPHYRHEQAMRTTFEEYYREVDKEEPSYFRNLICRRICDAPSADKAIETMHRRFGVVATTATLRDMTALLAETYGWATPPVRPITTDEERYAEYSKSAVFDDIAEKSAEDVRLYEYVRTYEVPVEAAKPVTPPPIEVRSEPAAPVSSAIPCPICGAPLENLDQRGDCPGCKSPARTRSLPAVLESVVGPHLAKTPNAALPLLAFATTGAERPLLTPYFKAIQPASLYGRYASDNMVGVDVRDLSRFAPASFSGAFGILLFDYFPEHEKALAELSRVIAPGGVFFTLILPSRVEPDPSPPVVARKIKPRPGYFDYIPEGSELLSVNVGQDWLLRAIARAGFTPLQLRVPDPATSEISQWFIGIRRDGVAASYVAPAEEAAVAATPPAAPAPPAAVSAPPIAAAASVPPKRNAAPAAAPPKPSPRPARPPDKGPALTNATRMTQSFSQEFVTPLEGYDGLKSITVRLTIPSVPLAGRGADFAEHCWIADESRSSRTINCVGPGVLMRSDDLGEHWDVVEVPELKGQQPINHFTTAKGTRLIQTVGWQVDREDRPREDWGAIFRLTADGAVTDRIKTGDARWHGPRAIGQSGDAILYSEYFDNADTRNAVPHSKEWPDTLRTNHVWRSDDDGKSWSVAFAQDPSEIRHFHFVMTDPYEPGTWWLSSGDLPHQCRCWRSRDNGATWQDVTNPHPDVIFHPSVRKGRQAVFRATDMAFLPDKLIWGTDDMLTGGDQYKLMKENPEKFEGYPRLGSRIFVAAREDMLQPTDVAVGGHPFRNLVDVGPGYIAMTEGKYDQIGLEPVVYFIGKDEPHRMQQLFTVPNAKAKGSGFSYSRASRAAVDGRFFSFRGSGDLVQMVPRLLQWDVAFA